MAPRLPSRVARVAALAAPDNGAPAQLGIVAPGTGGSASVVDAIVERLRRRDVPVLRMSGRRLERDDELGAVRELVGGAAAAEGAADERAHREALVARLADEGAALVVDEAQWLDAASLRVVVGVAERAAARGLTVAVAHRPVPGDPQLAALDAVLGRSQLLAALGPLDEAEAGELAAIVLDSAVDDRLVEAVHDQAQGMPELVELLLFAWVDAGVVSGGRLTVPPPPPGPALVAAVRSRVDELEPATRTVLAALSAGADLDDHLLGATTGIAPDRLGQAIDDLHAAGLVAAGTGEVVPLVAAAVTEMTPVADQRRFHSRLAAALAERRAPATRTGEHLAAAGAQGSEAAAAYVAAGDATLVEAPELATGWYERAIAAGTPPATIAARRAEAAALGGDAVTALRLADEVIAEPGSGERARALAVVAALLPGRGFWHRSSIAYRELAAQARRSGGSGAGSARNAAAWPLLAAIGSVATGGPLTGRGDRPATGATATGTTATVASGPAAMAAATAAASMNRATALPVPDAAARAGVGTAGSTPDRGVAVTAARAGGGTAPGSTPDAGGAGAHGLSHSGPPSAGGTAPGGAAAGGSTATGRAAPDGDAAAHAGAHVADAAAVSTALIDGAGADSAIVPGLEIEALRLTCDALATSTGADGGRPLATFLEAAELLESAHATLVLPTTPHAIGATVALALSELSTAEHLLTRARDHGVGGAPLQQHHRLGLGWVAVRSGRWAAAQAALDEIGGAALAPREVLLAAAIEAGLARRSGDLARLGDAWTRAEGVLLRHPADLFSLEVVGELAIGAARLGLWDRVAGKARELGDVVRALGEPPLWLLPLRWIGLQVALASDDHDATVRRAAEVEATRPVHPRLGALADAARTWVAILTGNADPDCVASAAKGLTGLGLTWEASRLTGQAAIRSSDPSVTRALLEQARDLKAALPASEPGEAATAASLLSEREQMVAQYIVDGLTHKEIGAQLYISPKTVEHHVAKIRQKLGASTRAEMLAALRSHLAS
jgi:DNA-binding NarL/FixJ family response regulator